MICDSCTNVIIRTFRNGGEAPFTVRVCCLDGATISHQLRECSRKEEKIVPVVETEIRLPEPEPDLPPLKEVAKSKRWKRGT